MIRKLILLPALALLFLGGCATYEYRSGAGGDYYYGQPSTEYRYYGYPYLGGYGYGGYGYGGYGYGSYGSYGYPYYGGYRYYGNRGGHYRPPYNHGPRPGNGNGGNPGHDPDPPTQGNNDQVRPMAPYLPGRDMDRVRERARDGVAKPDSSLPARRSAPVRTAPARTITPQRVAPPVRHAAPAAQPRSAAPRAGTIRKRDRDRITEL